MKIHQLITRLLFLFSLTNTYTIAQTCKPIADFNSDNTPHSCPPIAVHFYDLSSSDPSYPIIKWEYDFGDGTSTTFTSYSAAQNASKVYYSPGTFTVTLIVTNSVGCSDTIVKPNLIDNTGISATFSYSPNSGCAPENITFNISNMVGVERYTLAFGDFYSVSDTVSVIYHTYNSPGTFYPVLFIENASCNYPLPYQAPIVITGAFVNFTPDKDTLCGPGTINFTNNTNANGDSIASYIWDFGDGSNPITVTSKVPVSHLYNTEGLHTITLTANSFTTGCGPYITYREIYFENAPIGKFNYTPLSTTINSNITFSLFDTVNVYSYKWSFGDLSYEFDISPVNHKYSSNGIFHPSLELQNYIGCNKTISSSDSIVISPVSGVNIIYPVLTGIKIYPIPANDKLTFEISSKEELINITIELINITGKKILENKLSKLITGKNEINLITKELPSGIYFYQLTSETSILANGKVIIE